MFSFGFLTGLERKEIRKLFSKYRILHIPTGLVFPIKYFFRRNAEKHIELFMFLLSHLGDIPSVREEFILF